MIIINDDNQLVNVTLSVNPSSIAEAAGVSTVTARLSAVSGQAVTVAISSTQGSNNQFSYSNWNNGEPNDAGVGSGTENYAMIVNGGWNDISNTDGGISKNYLFETDQLINSLQGYQYIGQYQGHSYFKSNSTIGSWTAARDQAYKDGGYLVSITSEAEKNQVKSWYDNSTAFIGLYQDANDQNYSEPSGGWKWVEHWDQIGSDINGESDNDKSGHSFKL